MFPTTIMPLTVSICPGLEANAADLAETDAPVSSSPQELVDVGTNRCYNNQRHGCAGDFREKKRQKIQKLLLLQPWENADPDVEFL